MLRLVAQGLPGKQIAGALGISERTVKFHTASLIRKLGADNRAQAVALAAQRGLLEPPPRRCRSRRRGTCPSGQVRLLSQTAGRHRCSA